MEMTEVLIVLAVIVAVLVVGGAILAWLSKRSRDRRRAVRDEFGPEYHTARSQYGDGDRATKELEERRKRVESYDIRPLSPEDARRYSEQWTAAQAHFVDDPSAATTEADDLIGSVMQARGYPTGDFEQRSADASVGHAEVVQNYRAAHEIAERNRRGQAGTEDLRQAMVHYRSLFQEMLETEEAGATNR
jgi:hypothetical protein